MTEKEAMQLKLTIIHQNTAQEEVKYLAAIRVNVKKEWLNTLALIDIMKYNKESGSLTWDLF